MTLKLESSKLKCSDPDERLGCQQTLMIGNDCPLRRLQLGEDSVGRCKSRVGMLEIEMAER